MLSTLNKETIHQNKTLHKCIIDWSGRFETQVPGSNLRFQGPGVKFEM